MAEIETSLLLEATWRVELPGRPPYEVQEERRAPMWLADTAIAGGNRWYKVRVRSSYGFQPRLGVPCLVDPADGTRLWIDWDGAHREHNEAWRANARVQRARARRAGRIDHAIDLVTNPFAGSLRTEDAEQVAAEMAEEQAQAEEIASWSAARDAPPELAPQTPEIRRRAGELLRISQTGEKHRGRVVARDETDRVIEGVPVVVLTLEVEDGSRPPRRVIFEHVFGLANSQPYQPGKRCDVWVDPLDPESVCIGR